MAGSTALTVPLTDGLAPRFLTALERSGGSLHAASRMTNVKRGSVAARRYADPQFRNAVGVIRTQQLHDAGDQLFAAIDSMTRTTGSMERAIDALLHASFDRTEAAPCHDGAVREQLRTAGLKWARAVVQATAGEML